MLLAVDIGNTHTVLGIFNNERLIVHWRIRTEHGCTSDELGIIFSNLFAIDFLKMSGINGVIISSVVPPLNKTVDEFCYKYFKVKPVFVDSDIISEMFVFYDDPKEIGADRIVNAVAAYDRYSTDLILVDFGTATTFDCVSAKGEYLGGVIVPGIMISYEALFDKTSKLPRIEMFGKPSSVVAKNTVDAMNAGVFYGYAGMVDSVVVAINKERGLKCKVIATGGLAKIIAPQSKMIEEVDEYLTLFGLLILFLRKKNKV